MASVARKVCCRSVPGPALTRARPIYCMCVLLMHPRESRPSSSVRALHTCLAGASADSHILCAPSRPPVRMPCHRRCQDAAVIDFLASVGASPVRRLTAWTSPPLPVRCSRRAV